MPGVGGGEVEAGTVEMEFDAFFARPGGNALDFGKIEGFAGFSADGMFRSGWRRRER
jgi:hypothetical protein